jgi:hypothetical protein
VKDIAGSGVRWLDVAPARFPGWIASFARRHGGDAVDMPPGAALTVALSEDTAAFTAPDGAAAECYPPFPPLPAELPAEPGAVAEAIAAHALRPRTVGVLLVRLGGYAAGVFTGSPPELAAAKTGSRPVHGRSAAGGWSQQRFARRREKQASEALAAAANAAVDVFGRWSGTRVRPNGVITARGGQGARGGQERRGGGPRPGGQLDVVVLGGDKRAVAELRADPRLAPYLALAAGRFLTVPDPRRAVLADAPRLFLAVKIKLTEPSP